MVAIMSIGMIFFLISTFYVGLMSLIKLNSIKLMVHEAVSKIGKANQSRMVDSRQYHELVQSFATVKHIINSRQKF